jgi:hypothetical protein
VNGEGVCSEWRGANPCSSWVLRVHISTHQSLLYCTLNPAIHFNGSNGTAYTKASGSLTFLVGSTKHDWLIFVFKNLNMDCVISRQNTRSQCLFSALTIRGTVTLYYKRWQGFSNKLFEQQFSVVNYCIWVAVILPIKQSAEFSLSIISNSAEFWESICRSFQIWITSWKFEQNSKSLMCMSIETRGSRLMKNRE